MKGYGVEWKDATPGDLVMVFASDIDYPAVKDEIISPNYISVSISYRFLYLFLIV